MIILKKEACLKNQAYNRDFTVLLRQLTNKNSLKILLTIEFIIGVAVRALRGHELLYHSYTRASACPADYNCQCEPLLPFGIVDEAEAHLFCPFNYKRKTYKLISLLSLLN